MGIDIAQSSVFKPIRSCANNDKSQLIPQAQGVSIAGGDDIKLHRAKSHFVGLFQGIQPHLIAKPQPPRRFIHQIARITDIRAINGRIGFDDISADDFVILLCHDAIIAFGEPEIQSLLFRHGGIKHKAIARLYDRVEYPPNTVIIGRSLRTKGYHGGYPLSGVYRVYGGIMRKILMKSRG